MDETRLLVPNTIRLSILFDTLYKMNWTSKEGKNLIVSFILSSIGAFVVGFVNFNNFCEENRVQSSSCYTLQYQNSTLIFFSFGLVFGLTLIHYNEFYEKLALSLVSELFLLTLLVFYVGILYDGEYLIFGMFSAIFDFGSHLSNLAGMLIGSYIQKLVFR